MELNVASYDRPAMAEVFKGFADSKNIKLADGIEVQFRGIVIKKGGDFPEIAAFIITVASHVPAALAAELIRDWIVAQFSHKRTETITINELKIKFSKKGRMKEIIKKTVKHERN